MFFGNKRKERERIGMLIDILREQQPDIVALQEVDLGSVRSTFTNQYRTIAQHLREAGLEYEHRADVKYGTDTPIADLPVLRHMSNAIFWRNGTGTARYLSAGVKRLAHLVNGDDSPTVLSVHLSKTRETREEQFRELAGIVDGRDEVVLMGDFNVKDRAEFEPLTEGSSLELHVPGKSFSTAYPTYAYDVFLTSDGLSVESSEVLEDVRFSDHMPVVAEIHHD